MNLTITKNGSIQTPTIGSAKAAGPGWSGILHGIVTAVFRDYDAFVLEAEDRSAAITVRPLNSIDIRLRDKVTVEGVIETDGTLRVVGEPQRAESDIEIAPLGVNNRDIARPGGPGGLSNTDLLVRTWGKVLDVPLQTSDGTRFHVTDGSSSQGGGAVTVGSLDYLFGDDFAGPDLGGTWTIYGDPVAVQNGQLVLQGAWTCASVSGQSVLDAQAWTSSGDEIS